MGLKIINYMQLDTLAMYMKPGISKNFCQQYLLKSLYFLTYIPVALIKMVVNTIS
jgi:hypothetical protein